MFITLEGPDGSGKTTVTKRLEKYFEENNIPYLLTREPGASMQKVTRKIRNIILDKENKISNMTEALLYAADRRENLESNIWPALKEGKVVICDRFIDSSLAYQGVARGLGIDKIWELQLIITENTIPDLTIFFDIKPEESNKRVDSRDEKDRLELEGIKFKEKVYDGYRQIIKRFPKRIVEVDATKSRDDLFEDVKKIILAKIEGKS